MILGIANLTAETKQHVLINFYFLLFILIAIPPMGMRCYFTMVLIFITSVISDVKY